jgi:ORF6N domain
MTQPDPVLSVENTSFPIHLIREQRVILDTDLARLYGIQTFRLNEAVKRNRSRFPDDFLFQLSLAERDALTSQVAMSKTDRGGRRTLPFAAILKRLAEIDKTLLIHDVTLREILQKLRPLLEPPPGPPKPEIGFHVKEDHLPYRTKRKGSS